MRVHMVTIKWREFKSGENIQNDQNIKYGQKIENCQNIKNGQNVKLAKIKN